MKQNERNYEIGKNNPSNVQLTLRGLSFSIRLVSPISGCRTSVQNLNALCPKVPSLFEFLLALKFDCKIQSYCNTVYSIVFAGDFHNTLNSVVCI